MLMFEIMFLIQFFKEDERQLEIAKTDQKNWKKRVNDATRVLQREEPNLKEVNRCCLYNYEFKIVRRKIN